MATSNPRQIGPNSIQKPVSKIDTLHETWEVVKPFARFSVKAMKVIAHALIFVVKNIPQPSHEKPARSKNDKVIKI